MELINYIYQREYVYIFANFSIDDMMYYFIGIILQFGDIATLPLPKIKEIWHHHQLPLYSFSNLRILRVDDCEHLLNLIPRRLIQSFKNLKEIEVGFCANLRHVFVVQGYDDADHVQDGVHFLGEVSFLQCSFSSSLYYFFSEIL